MTLFTHNELAQLLRGESYQFVDKVFLLANGMIKVYGYSKEKAYKEAVNIAKEKLG